MSKSTNRAIAAECRKLETELSVLNRSIRNHPDDDKLYYSKAAALKKLASITGNKEKYTETLTSFNKAIEMDSENAFYLIKRAELLITMRRNQEAFNDLQAAVRFAKDILAKPSGDLSIEEMATVNAIRDVAKLDDMNKSIKALVAEGKLDKDMEHLFIDHIRSVESIMVQTLNDTSLHDQLVRMLNDKLSEIQSQIKTNGELTAGQIDTVKAELRAQAIKLDVLQVRITEIESVAQSLGKRVDENQAMSEQDRIQVKESIDKINSCLKSLNSKVEVNDPILKKMVDSVRELLDHKDISLENINDLWQKIEEQDLRIVQNSILIAKMQDEAMHHLSIVDKQMQEQFKKIAATEVEQIEVRSAIQLIEKSIKETPSNTNSEDKRIPEIIEELSKLSSSNESNISRILNLSKKLRAMETSEKKTSHEEKKTDVYQAQPLSKEQSSSEMKFEKKDSEVTQINYLTEITYDNELLNHPEMFNRLASIYGADKVPDLSSQLPQQLLHQAIIEGNLDLLGNILSLD